MPRRLPLLPADVPTASRIGLALRCTYPWTSGRTWPARSAGEDALIGTAVHQAAEEATRNVDLPFGLSSLSEDARETATDLIEAVRDCIREERATTWSWRLYDAEVPVEFDLHTGAGRVLPSSGHRDYSERVDTGIVGTIDHLLCPEDGLLTVRDWKTGGRRGFAREAARMQVRTLAVAVAAIHGVEEVATEIAHITTSGVEIDRDVLDDAAIGDHIDRLYELADRLGAGPTSPTSGAWCTDGMCPLLGECPATRGALAAVVNEAPVFEVFDDNAEALRLIDLLPRARAALEAAEEKLKQRIRRDPPTGPDGRRYGYVEQEKRDLVVSSPAQLAALRSVLGVHADSVVQVKSHASIAAVERAARRVLGGSSDGIGELRDRALAELAKVGGVKVRKYHKAKWFWPDGVRPAVPEALPETAEECLDFEG